MSPTQGALVGSALFLATAVHPIDPWSTDSVSFNSFKLAPPPRGVTSGISGRRGQEDGLAGKSDGSISLQTGI